MFPLEVGTLIFFSWDLLVALASILCGVIVNFLLHWLGWMYFPSIIVFHASLCYNYVGLLPEEVSKGTH